jgi:hypothetical protein
MVKVVSLLLVLSLVGCSSLEIRNLGKTGVTTGIAYVVAGPIPAIANLATSMAYDEIIPDKPSIDKIENKEQAVAYVLEKGIVWSVVGFIAFLLITNVLVPLLTRRWGYNEAKNKYREVIFQQDKE